MKRASLRATPADRNILLEYLDAIIEAMEQPDKKDDLVKQITDLLTSLLSRGLTEEEVAIVLVQDIVLPELEKAKDANAQLAFAHKSSKFYQ